MRGRYLMQKVELLLSFYLLAPLWGGLARAVALVGGAARAGGRRERDRRGGA
jgi:hypothetical protein